MELIEEAKESCDYLAVYTHWGVEYDAYPQDYQTKIATDCIEAGADLVVGSHTHCLQGAAWIEGKPVIYSLGNFMFGREIDRSAILKVTVSSDGTATYAYIPIYAESGCTKIAASDKAASILNYLDSISSAAISDTGDIEK
jgi:poly-gamma-glutamate synthesis protein (capsule biosynthesis protein)